ncbi:peroxiredoxin [Candidatus Pacearchaeota archaeon]|nr:peroxiredoxin [Candidatus Pacearchaeota archaeon]
MPLEKNSKIIDFALKDKNGKVHTLSNYNDKIVILYFYPKDNTPGCTIEAIDFTNNKDAFDQLDAIVIGISGGNEKTKTKFCEKHGLNVLLLSEPDFEISKKYKVYSEKSFLGKKFMGIKRTTFIIQNGKIVKVFDNVKPTGHAQEVLDFLHELRNKR